MLMLYYWPGASSVIPHITLEEIGAPYKRKLINLAKGEHKSDAYLKINPRGKVPAPFIRPSPTLSGLSALLQTRPRSSI
jgi:hypothetical protein